MGKGNVVKVHGASGSDAGLSRLSRSQRNAVDVAAGTYRDSDRRGAFLMRIAHEAGNTALTVTDEMLDAWIRSAMRALDAS